MEHGWPENCLHLATGYQNGNYHAVLLVKDKYQNLWVLDNEIDEVYMSDDSEFDLRLFQVTKNHWTRGLNDTLRIC